MKRLFSTLVVLLGRASATCYGANTTIFSWCKDYVKDGYNCSGDMCASDRCPGGSCPFCAVEYAEAVLDEASGRCCSSIDGATCVDPRSGSVHNPPYGFPDHHAAFIVEGLAAYPYGPPVWSTSNPSGLYGFSFIPSGWGNTPEITEDAHCPPIPDEIKVDRKEVTAMSVKQHAPGTAFPKKSCFLGCYPGRVAASGVDPCNGNSGTSPTGGPYNMSCFSGGADWLKPHGLGMCGYNCTLRAKQNPNQFCTDDPASNCFIFCNVVGFGFNVTSSSEAAAGHVSVVRSSAAAGAWT